MTPYGSSRSVVLHLQMASESPGGLVKTQGAGTLIPRISDPVGLGWSPIVCISDQFKGDAEAAAPGTPVREPQLGKGNVDGFGEPFNNLLFY